MISKNRIKFLRSLSLKKNREKHHQVILEGYRLVEEVIKSDAEIECIYCTPKTINRISKNKLFDPYEKIMIPEKDCQMIAETKNTQGIIALVNTEKYLNNKITNIKNENIIILDQVSDPGNLGAIFRNSIWFGIQSIILTENSIDPFNLKCIRSGMGSHFYFNNIIQEHSKKIIQYLKKNKYNVIVADLDGKNIKDINHNNYWALILGSEAHGISNDFKEFEKVTINKIGNIESLNVSVASGIILDRLINDRIKF